MFCYFKGLGPAKWNDLCPWCEVLCARRKYLVAPGWNVLVTTWKPLVGRCCEVVARWKQLGAGRAKSPQSYVLKGFGVLWLRGAGEESANNFFHHAYGNGPEGLGHQGKRWKVLVRKDVTTRRRGRSCTRALAVSTNRFHHGRHAWIHWARRQGGRNW